MSSTAPAPSPAPVAPSRRAVGDASQVRGAVEQVAGAARAAGFAPAAVDTVVLAATELAENLHRHAVGGEVLVLPPPTPADALIVLAVDRGPGVDRFERCLVDGYSTIGTLGVGLGTVVRSAGRFDALSEPGRGTVVGASFRHDGTGRLAAPGADGGAPPAFDVGAVGFPLYPDAPNGDSWSALHRGARLIVTVADGLGHGPAAAEASRAVVEAVPGVADRSPEEMLAALAGAARHTRGAAVTVATLTTEVAREGGTVASAGLGNVSLVALAPDGSARRGVTFPGTVGRAAPPPRSAPLLFPAGGTWVLHSDGLHQHWDLTGRAEVLRHDAVVVAAALWRDHARGTDDTCVVVVRPGLTS